MSIAPTFGPARLAVSLGAARPVLPPHRRLIFRQFHKICRKTMCYRDGQGGGDQLDLVERKNEKLQIGRVPIQLDN